LLQDNVAECINDFRSAKIKAWMLTGDKKETAHTIGITCGLINNDTDKAFFIDSKHKSSIKDNL